MMGEGSFATPAARSKLRIIGSPNKASSQGLDALRMFFAALVLVSHSTELIDGNRSREPLTRVVGTCSLAELAVIGFFVLSGYLISSSWRRNPSWSLYLRNRVLRIAPAFIVAGSISAVVVGAIGASGVAAYFQGFDWLELTKDLVSLQSPTTPRTFEGSPYPAVNGSLWTIRYEFLCYLLAPLALLHRRILAGGWWFALVLTILSPSPLPRFLLAFLSGAMFQELDLKATRAAVYASLVVFPLSLASTWAWEVGASIAGGYLTLCLGKCPLPFRWPDFSYGLYLYGWPIQKLLVLGGIVQPFLLFIATLPLAAACGLLSWHFIERPALRLKRKAPSGDRPVTALPVASA